MVSPTFNIERYGTSIDSNIFVETTRTPRVKFTVTKDDVG